MSSEELPNTSEQFSPEQPVDANTLPPIEDLSSAQELVDRVKRRFKALGLAALVFSLPLILGCGFLENQKSTTTQSSAINLTLPTATSWQQEHNAPFYAQATLQAAPPATPVPILQHNYTPSLQSAPDYSVAAPPVPGQP